MLVSCKATFPGISQNLGFAKPGPIVTFFLASAPWVVPETLADATRFVSYA